MTLEIWPAGLPQRWLKDGHSRKNANKPNATPTDGGRMIVRKSTVRVAKMMSASFEMNGTQFAAFETFYYTTILEGTARFEMPVPNPDYSYTTRVVLMDPEAHPDSEPVGGGFWRVSFNVMVFPNA